ncbi:class I SAM-dependent methyltransferase [Palleronia caenipelagi]|uniref:Class I SAM-dependent methyltransferase n=1 Tax=Palleronia caenipelagi TaxID=2489174 RepID=A0A547PY16_9RHOB|nr:class I SAM-dependent methyltransferase [Palleronia caenipelagi]TRD19043.1 class I SAM-dependent methyltransferase [Palleronia caenipelagi]
MDNSAQEDFWNGDQGRRWADLSPELDAHHLPVTGILMARAGQVQGHTVLDVGCGQGALTEALWQAGARVTGLDLSSALLARARRHLPAEVTLLRQDVTEYRPEASFDLVISQFGVMFFADDVEGFADLRRITRPGGRLIFASWSGAEHNPWFSVPRRLAVDRLGDVPGDPDAPGPFRLRDIDRTCEILRTAGWFGVSGRAVDLHLTPAGSLAEVADFATRLGGASAVIRQRGGGEADRQAVAADVAEAFAPYATSEGVLVPARINLFEARA